MAYHCGQRAFGENYARELGDKVAQLADLDLEWHYIGPIQRNKTRSIAANAAWVHGIDRFEVASRLAAQRPAELPPLQVCLQVNLDAEPSKAGIAPRELAGLAQAVAQLDPTRLRLRGLMCIPRPQVDPVAQRLAFAALRECRATLRREGLALDTLSMGMSDDYCAAIAEGATLIRIGTAIFGTRR